MDDTAFICSTRVDNELFNSVPNYFFLHDIDIDNEDFMVEMDEENSEEFELESEENNMNLTSDSVTEMSTVVSSKPKRKRIYKKRKRVRKKDPFFIPRILKRDLRRQFPIMMANVFNSHDYELIRSFFLTFSSQNMTLKKNPLTLEFFSTNQNNALFRVKDDGQWTLNGPHWMIYHWHVLNRINPDQIIRLQESTIHTSSGTSKSKISFVIEISFTRIFDIEDDKFVNNIFEFIRNTSPNEFLTDISSNGIISLPDPFDYYLQKTGATMPLLSHPQNVRLRAKATYHFDEQKHIEMVEILDASIASCLIE